MRLPNIPKYQTLLLHARLSLLQERARVASIWLMDELEMLDADTRSFN